MRSYLAVGLWGCLLRADAALHWPERHLSNAVLYWRLH